MNNSIYSHNENKNTHIVDEFAIHKSGFYLQRRITEIKVIGAKNPCIQYTQLLDTCNLPYCHSESPPVDPIFGRKICDQTESCKKFLKFFEDKNGKLPNCDE